MTDGIDFCSQPLITNIALDSSQYKIEVLANDYFKYVRHTKEAVSPFLPEPLCIITQEYLAIR